MSKIYYKKKDEEVFEYVAGRMKKSSCDSKYIQCDVNGKEIKKVPKEVKKEVKESKGNK